MKKILMFFSVLVLTSVLFLETAQALRLTVKRIVFEGPKRAEFITVINNSDKEETYRLGWRHFRMTENSSLEFVPDDQLTDDIKPVVDMIRFAPRRFTVPPRSSQQVRIVLRTPANLPDGEYRSHLWVHPEADVEELRAEAIERDRQRGVKQGVSLSMLTGVTMPIIVRKGAFEATASVANLNAAHNGGFIDVSYSLLREGQNSVYGEVEYICNPDSTPYTLKLTRGVAIYPEVTQRNFNFRIPKLEGVPACSNLAVSFVEAQGFAGERGQILAQAKTQIKQ